MAENVRLKPKQQLALKPKQQLAITALLTGSNIEQASEAAGVDPRTLNRWMKETAFKTTLDDSQAEMTRTALRRLAGLLEKGIDELETLLSNAGLKPQEKLQVVRTILNGYPRFHETIGIEDRLAEIERLLK